MPAIHQLVAGFSRGDAISNEALAMQRIFRGWGCDADIFCERKRILPEMRALVRDLDEAPAACGPADVALLHLSIGSPANERFAGLRARKALLYHNITPPDYFRLINARTALDLARGHEQVRALAGVAAVNLADSRFNACELEALGYGPVAVLPLILDFARLQAAPDRRVLAQFRDGLVNVLFVGRCAPNKKLEDVLQAFARFQQAVEPASRLIFVGSHAGTERYYRLLVTLVRDLRLQNVCFTGSVPQSELNAYYRCSDLFLCMSEHEGFCIPLVESMLHAVPVMAYRAAAVPETLNGAGILFDEKAFDLVAELMGRVARPGLFREAVVRHQRDVLAGFRGRDLGAELRTHLQPLLA